MANTGYLRIYFVVKVLSSSQKCTITLIGGDVLQEKPSFPLVSLKFSKHTVGFCVNIMDFLYFGPTAVM